MKNLENTLDKLFRNIVHSIYNERCIWSDEYIEGIRCEGALEVSHLIPRSNNYFRWDFNNGVLMCSNHHKWWHGVLGTSSGKDGAQAIVKLRETHPFLYTFMKKNRHRTIMQKPDLRLVKDFLINNSNLAIEQGEAPFPSIYGIF